MRAVVFGHYGVVEAGDVDAFFLHAGGINLGEFGIIQHDGADGALCRLDVETGGGHLVAEVVYVFQQFVMQGIALFEHLEYLELAPMMPGANELEKRYGRLRWRSRSMISLRPVVNPPKAPPKALPKVPV